MDVKSQSPRIVPEINVTPLVDVVLVLLIIFMVIAPQLEAGERVELPALANVDEKAKLDAFTLTVTASGRFMLEKEHIEEAALHAALVAAHERDPEKRMVLKADRGLTYEKMRRLFSEAREIGFNGVALMVDEKQKHVAEK
ncbi:MAG TPA: biopolymer transporter ExbD [Polyangiaceae bacterium]|jgi:biopolymer transport protein ExbD|nr:biopolymer transporter ExbD [Polyangiaceae bacterium]